MMCGYHLTVCDACVSLERFTGKTIISKIRLHDWNRNGSCYKTPQ